MKKISLFLCATLLGGSIILLGVPAQAYLLYSNNFEESGEYFASGVSGGFSGGVDEAVIYPGQTESFTGPIVDTSTTFENDSNGATFMENQFYLGGGTKGNEQPGTPRDPVVLSLSGVSNYYNSLVLEFDLEAIGSWDGSDGFSITLKSTPDETLFEGLPREFADSLSFQFDYSLDTLEVQWINNNSGRDEFFGLDNVRVSAIPEPGTVILLGSGILLGIGLLRRKLGA